MSRDRPQGFVMAGEELKGRADHSAGMKMPTLSRACLPVRRDPLDRAYGFLDRHAPEKLASAFRALRKPGLTWLRAPLGVFFVVCSFFWFLPVVGLEFLPLGLLLLAEDVPSLRNPVGRFVLWLELKYCRALRWWRGRRVMRVQRPALA
ncbi:MAG TPA: hypothetical protein VGN97_09665 [Mesorhizobium sp.]|nr:hypothetical protein [Mesorhizobium sp.]